MDTTAITTAAANARVHLAMVGGDGAPLCRQAKANSCKTTDRVATCRKCIKIGKQPMPEVAAALAVYQAAHAAHLKVCDAFAAASDEARQHRTALSHSNGTEPWAPIVTAKLLAADAAMRVADVQWDVCNAIATEALNAFRAVVHGKGLRVRDYIPGFAD